jgi:TonB family protein
LSGWLLYRFFLKEKGLAGMQRTYLIGVVLLGVFMPLIPGPTLADDLIQVVLPTIYLGAEPVFGQSLPSKETGFSWVTLLMTIYLAGVFYQVVRHLLGLYTLFQLTKIADRRTIQGEAVCFVPGLSSPFQFAGMIYLPANLDKDEDAFNMAFQHERAHRLMGHTYDLLFVAIMKILFWFHPVLQFITKELKLVHEFQADEAVVKASDRDRYVYFIGTFHAAPPVQSMVNTIIQGPLKLRIMKMYQNQTNWHHRQWILLGFSFMVMLLFTAFVNRNHPASGMMEQPVVMTMDTIPPSPPTPPTPPKNDAAAPPANKMQSGEDMINSAPSLKQEEVLTVAEEMPRFPGCEDVDDTREKVACAQQAMLTFIFKNLQYPKDARLKKIEGRVITSFVIEKDGSVGDIKVLKDIGAGCGEETVRVMKLMNEKGIKWIPGQQNGKKVRVQYSLPIQFKLDSENKDK